jgi:excisionase family DNA binding protein
MASPLILTVPEAASYLGRSPEFVRRLVGSGRIPAERVGARLYVSRRALDTLGAPESDSEPIGVREPLARLPRRLPASERG